LFCFFSSSLKEAALVEALKEGILAGVGLDVMEQEPYTSGPLLAFENVIMTPHSAYYSDASHEEIVRKASEEARRVLLGEKPWYCVNLPCFKAKK
jgi:phosphoglycerate dehydrogenase-like enzyme